MKKMKKEKKNTGWTSSDHAKLKRMVKAMLKEDSSMAMSKIFKAVSTKLGRTANACAFQYYAVTGNNKKKVLGKAAKQPKASVKKTTSSVKKITVIFDIETDWSPSRVSSVSIDPFLNGIADTAAMLTPGQSFPIPYQQLKQKFGWAENSVATSVRHVIRKIAGSDVSERVSIHKVKDANNAIVQIRVFRYPEA